MASFSYPERACISLSILEYEDQLERDLNNFNSSDAFSIISQLVRTGILYSMHIDVMRPPLIPYRSAFSKNLIKELYEFFHDDIFLEMHLMAEKPDQLIEEINNIVNLSGDDEISIIIHRESYPRIIDVVKCLKNIKGLGFKAGIGLNLPTSTEELTDDIVENADIILVMSVPMGMGGQMYADEATEKIRMISKRFPDKLIEVDGGINDKTINHPKRAGAKVLIVGSFITRSRSPLSALKRLEEALKDP